jgi:hypothetical protein
MILAGAAPRRDASHRRHGEGATRGRGDFEQTARDTFAVSPRPPCEAWRRAVLGYSGYPWMSMNVRRQRVLVKKCWTRSTKCPKVKSTKSSVAASYDQ